MTTWTASVGGEGGPLLICEADAYAHWTGAVLTEDYELEPWCDMVRADAALYPDDDEVEAATVGFGDGLTGVVWQMDGPGTADVAATPDGFLVARGWAGRKPVTSVEEESPAFDFPIETGAVVIVWAPVGFGEVGDFAGPEQARDALRALAAFNPPVALHQEHILHVGTLLRVVPGVYSVVVGQHSGKDGRYADPADTGPRDHDCRWIRFARR